ncbi:hypothetical protein Droror1_Dr00018519 [Drosera rotundifolia]
MSNAIRFRVGFASGFGKDEMCGIGLRHNCHPIVEMILKKELVIYKPSIGLILVVGVVSGRDMKERAVMATSGIDTATRGETFVATRMDINYMSKRKVFNGPDPIHNRRAGNSRQPPGKA